MPIPKPFFKEKKGDYMARCMDSKQMKKDYKDRDQRLAVCFSTWRKYKNK